jgi:hypothetical protein
MMSPRAIAQNRQGLRRTESAPFDPMIAPVDGIATFHCVLGGGSSALIFLVKTTDRGSC